MRRQALTTAAALVLAASALPATAGDILQLRDGRFVEGVPLKVDGDHVVLGYQNGDVRIPMSRVEDYLIEGAPPPDAQSDDERDKRASGLVPFRGRWVTPVQRSKLIDKEVADRRAAMLDAREHQEWRNRYTFSTKNFDFESTLPPSVNDQYAELLEAYFAEFKKMWGVRVPREWGKLKVCFYHDRDTFQRTAGVSGGVLAYYRFVAPRELNFYYDRSDPDDTIWTMFHEANHYLTDLMDEDFQYPHWINEAMAEYWSSSRYDPATGKMSVGALQEGRLVEVKTDIDSGKALGLEQLVSSEARDYEHYYWGWSFVHFMLESKDHQKRFKDFFTALARAKDVERVPGPNGFRTVTGEECLRVFLKRMKMKREDLPTLQAEWRAYIDALAPTGTRGLEEAGLSALRNGRALRAKRLLGEAVAAGSESVPVHVRYAQMLRVDDAGMAEAEKLLRRAVEIDPLAARAWAELGYTVYLQKREEEGKRLVGLAREIDPDDPYLLIEIHEALVEHAESQGDGAAK